MSQNAKQTEVATAPAPFAGSVRRLLLVVCGVGFLGVGAAVGLLLQRQLLPKSETAASPASTSPDSSTEEHPSAHQASPADSSPPASVQPLQGKSPADAAGHAGAPAAGSLTGPATESIAHQVVTGHSSENTDPATADSGSQHEHLADAHSAEAHSMEAASEVLDVIPEANPALDGDIPLSDVPDSTNPSLPDEESGPFASSGMPEISAAPAAGPASPGVPALFVSPQESPRDELLAKAEQLFLEENFRGARDRYRHLVSGMTNPHEAMVLLKFGLCEEVLGNVRSALSAYRHLNEMNPSPQLQEAALLGQARIWAMTDRQGLATAALYRQLLAGLSTDVHSPTLHLLGCLVARRVQADGNPSIQSELLLRDNGLLSPPIAVHPGQIIHDLQRSEFALPESNTGGSARIRLQPAPSREPLDVQITLTGPLMSSRELVQGVLQTAGWKLNAQEDIRNRLLDRSVAPRFQSVPMSLLLDAVLEPLGMVWSAGNQEILIQNAEEASSDVLKSYRREMALRVLDFAVQRAPRHRDCVATRIEHARVYATASLDEQAIRILEQTVEMHARSDYLPYAWFNLGKIQLRQGRGGDASASFYRAADMRNGESLEAISYLYVGRIQIENDDFRKATMPLNRAVALTAGTVHEGLATLELSSLYLMLENGHRANTLLMEHLQALEQPGIRDQAAFLSSLIQYRMTTESHDRFRAGTTLIQTLTNLKLRDCFGGHWTYLAAQAYRDTGMTQDSVLVLRNGLNTSYPFPLQNRMRSLLLLDAPELLTLTGAGQRSIDAGSVPQAFQIDALLTEAEASYHSSQFDQSIRTCREILDRCQVTEAQRRAILKLMGSAYQAQGKYHESVQCFTGVVPGNPLPPLPETAADSKAEAKL
jgi:tetratricopeptide (TPR) repeat protein